MKEKRRKTDLPTILTTSYILCGNLFVAGKKRLDWRFGRERARP